MPADGFDDWEMAPRGPAPGRGGGQPVFPSPRNVLSPEEIEALLRPDLSDMPPEHAPPAAPAPLPDLGTSRTHPIEEEAAQRLAARLSLALRDGCGFPAAATLAGQAEGRFAGLVSDIKPERGLALVCYAGQDGDVLAVLALSGPLAQQMIETACGGTMAPNAGVRALSPMDIALLEGLVRPLGPAIGEGLAFAGIETDPSFAAAIVRPGTASALHLSVRGPGGAAPARLIVSGLLRQPPASAAQPLPAGTAPGPALTVLLTARAARLHLPLSRLACLRPGALLLLGVPADQPVEILSGDVTGPVAAEAQIGRKGSQIALKITRRGPALAGLSPPARG